MQQHDDPVRAFYRRCAREKRADDMRSLIEAAIIVVSLCGVLAAVYAGWLQ